MYLKRTTTAVLEPFANAGKKKVFYSTWKKSPIEYGEY